MHESHIDKVDRKICLPGNVLLAGHDHLAAHELRTRMIYRMNTLNDMMYFRE